MIFSLNIRVQPMDLLDGEDPPKKVGCRKKSYFLEFMNVGFGRNLAGVVFPVLLDGAIVIIIIIIIIIIKKPGKIYCCSTFRGHRGSIIKRLVK